MFGRKREEDGEAIMQMGQPPAGMRAMSGYSFTYATRDGGVFARCQWAMQGVALMEWYCKRAHCCGIVDTAATHFSLTHGQAQKLGINLARLRYDTAINCHAGRVQAASVVIPEVVIGPIRVTNVDAVIAREPIEKLGFIGLSFLDRIGAMHRSKEGVTLYQ